jgi:hypothetical protein
MKPPSTKNPFPPAKGGFKPKALTKKGKINQSGRKKDSALDNFLKG